MNLLVNLLEIYFSLIPKNTNYIHIMKRVFCKLSVGLTVYIFGNNIQIARPLESILWKILKDVIKNENFLLKRNEICTFLILEFSFE